MLAAEQRKYVYLEYKDFGEYQKIKQGYIERSGDLGFPFNLKENPDSHGFKFRIENEPMFKYGDICRVWDGEPGMTSKWVIMQIPKPNKPNVNLESFL